MVKKNILKRAVSLIVSACLAVTYAGFSAYADNGDGADDIVEILATEDEMADDGESETSDDGENTGDAENASVENTVDNAVAGGGNDDVKEVTVPARSIRLSGSQRNNLVIGETFQINYKLSPKNSDDYIKKYTNFGRTIVKVDNNGLVTAIGYGTAKVQLTTTSGRKVNIYFTVTDAEGNDDVELEKGEVESIDFLSRNAMVHVGNKVQIEPLLYPLGITDDLTYKSNNTGVAKVSSSGAVTAVSDGSTTITVTASSGVSADFNISVYSDVYRGIDVSRWQGDINWNKVASKGIDFAMIRSSFGSEHTDEKLKANVEGCEKYGISYGFYHYTYAATVKEAKVEAKYFLKTIKNYNPDYPVVLDIEENFYKQMSRKQVTDIIAAFVSELENAGYYPAVYSYANFFRDYVDMSRISKYDIWIASWGDKEKLNSAYDGLYDMWQYSATGKVSGISGDVDLDYSYKNYPSIIKKKGLNKF